MSRGQYVPVAINNLTGTVLGGGSNTSTYLNVVASNGETADKVPVSTHSQATYQGAGTINYSTPSVIQLGQVNNLNGIAANDFNISSHSELLGTATDHPNKYGRKNTISSIDNQGNVTYGSTYGDIYGLYPVSGATPVDKAADAAADPWGTPARLTYLGGVAPITTSFSPLTDM